MLTKGEPSLSHYSPSSTAIRTAPSKRGESSTDLPSETEALTAGDPFSTNLFPEELLQIYRAGSALQVGFEGSCLSLNWQKSKSILLKKSGSLTTNASPSLSSLPSQRQSTRLDCPTGHVHLARPNLLCQRTSAPASLTAGFWRALQPCRIPVIEDGTETHGPIAYLRYQKEGEC